MDAAIFCVKFMIIRMVIHHFHNIEGWRFNHDEIHKRAKEQSVKEAHCFSRQSVVKEGQEKGLFKLVASSSTWKLRIYFCLIELW